MNVNSGKKCSLEDKGHHYLNLYIARSLLYAVLYIVLDVYFLFLSDFEIGPREVFMIFLKGRLLIFRNFFY